MIQTPRADDPLWPRAASWIVPAPASAPAPGTALPDAAGAASTAGATGPCCDLALIGVPAYASSITPTGAHATPAAVREALRYYSTYAGSRRIDVGTLTALDFGDVHEPDGPEGEARVRAAVTQAAAGARLLVAIGGDNSITCPVATALAGGDLADFGLITIDAHHDLRDGTTNGSPVRRLVEAGLPGRNIVQLGIADFSNSASYAQRALEYGITVVHRSEFAHRPLAELLGYALGRAGADGRRVFVDIDVDACDRAEVPACPSAAPGGFSAYELREMAYLLASDSRVAGMDITEIDATIDTHDRRTIRLAALLVLEAAAGVAARG